MEFPEGLKKWNVENPGVNKKRSGISRYDQEKNSVEFPWVLVFVLGIPMGVTRFGEISKDKVTNVKKFQGSFSKKYVLNTLCFDFFWNSSIQEPMQGNKS